LEERVKSLLKKYKEETVKVDDALRDQLIMDYAPLIKFIAQKIAIRLPSNIELDDLTSAGVIGLMDAIEKYDPTRDNKFKTYAEFRIRGAILDELRSQDWVPRSVREKAKKIEKVYAALEQKLGRTATEKELAYELDMNLFELNDLISQVKAISLMSLDEMGGPSQSDRKSLLDCLENLNAKNPYTQLKVSAMKNVLMKAIEDLPETQRLVLSLYYYEDLNLKEIGRILLVTESRVSQLHTQAVLKLRSRLKDILVD